MRPAAAKKTNTAENTTRRQFLDCASCGKELLGNQDGRCSMIDMNFGAIGGSYGESVTRKQTISRGEMGSTILSTFDKQGKRSAAVMSTLGCFDWQFRVFAKNQAPRSGSAKGFSVDNQSQGSVDFLAKDVGEPDGELVSSGDRGKAGEPAPRPDRKNLPRSLLSGRKALKRYYLIGSSLLTADRLPTRLLAGVILPVQSRYQFRSKDGSHLNRVSPREHVLDGRQQLHDIDGRPQGSYRLFQNGFGSGRA